MRKRKEECDGKCCSVLGFVRSTFPEMLAIKMSDSALNYEEISDQAGFFYLAATMAASAN